MRIARVDANQKAIVAALRACGVTVQHLHQVGAGCPDLLCAVSGHVFLVEVKDGAKSKSEQKLTPDQVIWHAAWQAEVHVINSIDDALLVANRYRSKA
tara:strand:+ start:291 stop:584 length:294 start_codon:yes stop_codon:yes gene_type:complete